MRLVHSPTFVALLLFTFFYSGSILYCRYFLNRDPGSVFFDESKAYTREYSKYRQEQAERFIIDDVERTDRTFPKASPDAKICVAIPTVNRGGFEYITVCLQRPALFEAWNEYWRTNLR